MQCSSPPPLPPRKHAGLYNGSGGGEVVRRSERQKKKQDEGKRSRVCRKARNEKKTDEARHKRPSRFLSLSLSTALQRRYFALLRQGSCLSHVHHSFLARLIVTLLLVTPLCSAKVRLQRVDVAAKEILKLNIKQAGLTMFG